MIKNFETVKSQLSELADIINSFKSEAVQLRIIELVLGAAKADTSGDIVDKESGGRKRSRRRQRVNTSKSDESGEPKTRKSSPGTGAAATLTRLAESSFFDKPRTINDIVEHSKHKLARTFKPNEFSGTLARMTRLGTLARQKNADNQYEYKKP